MKMRTTCLPAAVCALFLAAGAGAKEARRPDAWITTKVKSTLAAHKNVSAINTHVETKNGVVILRGDVDTMAEKDLTERYAKGVEGVRRVDNQLVVKGDQDVNDSDRASESASYPRSSSDGPSDTSLTMRVKAALLGNRSTSAFRTEVDADNGAVTLRGTAKSPAERDMAEKVVRDVNGVRSVDNQIEVR